MDVQFATTPFGGRLMSLALLSAQRNTLTQIPADRVIDKWKLYKALCEGKTMIGVSDRSLAVLSALLSFYPDSDLSKENGLIVFPSNKQLSLRAHGMPDPTLRRHLAALVQTGLILRRDSPNGKRYAHKSKTGELEEAFGFSLAPLLVRSDEIMAAAERVSAENVALRRTRERITLQRRDIAKLIEVALQEAIPGDWAALFGTFRTIVDAIPRRANRLELNVVLSELTRLRLNIDNALRFKQNDINTNANAAHHERQHIESPTELSLEFELVTENAKNKAKPTLKPIEPANGLTLSLVLKACPDIEEYATTGIGNWRDLQITAAQVRRYLNISPSAYEEALDVLGQENTAIVIGCILQRITHIQSAGGYLRSLTEKARAGDLSIGSMVMANLKSNHTAMKIAA